MFNRYKDSIAISLTQLRIRKSLDGPVDKYMEPYIIAIITDYKDDKLRINYKYFDFYNVEVYEQVITADTALLIYGPDNPGKFVTLSLALMESDEGIRKAGEKLDEIIKEATADTNIFLSFKQNPVADAAMLIAENILKFATHEMIDNEDDKAIITHDYWLQDDTPPYNVNNYKLHNNSFAEITLRIYPLISSNNDRWFTLQ